MLVVENGSNISIQLQTLQITLPEQQQQLNALGHPIAFSITLIYHYYLLVHPQLNHFFKFSLPLQNVSKLLFVNLQTKPHCQMLIKLLLSYKHSSLLRQSSNNSSMPLGHPITFSITLIYHYYLLVHPQPNCFFKFSIHWQNVLKFLFVTLQTKPYRQQCLLQRKVLKLLLSYKHSSLLYKNMNNSSMPWDILSLL